MTRLAAKRYVDLYQTIDIIKSSKIARYRTRLAAVDVGEDLNVAWRSLTDPSPHNHVRFLDKAVYSRVLPMDEPLGALDRKLREAMQLEIIDICREAGHTVLCVTHDQEEARRGAIGSRSASARFERVRSRWKAARGRWLAYRRIMRAARRAGKEIDIVEGKKLAGPGGSPA